MPQFRLTHKFAKDLKIPLSRSPETTFHPLDDWIGDTFHVKRRKVALLTHVKTLTSFIFPYREVGGARNIFNFFPLDIEQYLDELDLNDCIDSTNEVFSKPPIFTKTENHKVLGHMNDFKQCIIYSYYASNEPIDWVSISNELKEMPVNFNGSFTTPETLLLTALESEKSHLI